LTHPIKLIAIDLDGTLLKDDKTISPHTIDTIQRCTQQGIAIIIATTRAISFVTHIHQQLQLSTPVICATGAEVWEKPSGSLWARQTIPLPVAQAIATLADKNGWLLSTTVLDTRYWRQKLGQDLSSTPPDVHIVKTNLDAMHSEPTKILAKNPSAIRPILTLCQEQFPDQCRTEVFHTPEGDEESIVVVSKDADKGTALQVVLEKLEIHKDNTMTIGDNNNDLPMFRQSGLAVAMGNALDNIKSQADLVTDTNENEGVAKIIKQYVLSTN